MQIVSLLWLVKVWLTAQLVKWCYRWNCIMNNKKNKRKGHPIFQNSLLFVEVVGRFWEYIYRWTCWYTLQSDLEGKKYLNVTWAYIWLSKMDLHSHMWWARSWTNWSCNWVILSCSMSLEKFDALLENLQIYHNGRFTYFSIAAW